MHDMHGNCWKLRRQWDKNIMDGLTQYCSDDKIEANVVGMACSAYEEGKGVYRVWVGKPGGKETTGETQT
jgi:hypothetical protein